MNYNFTPAQVRWEITRLATKYPDFNYKRDSGIDFTDLLVKPSCLYVFENKPSCIVGQALSNLGVPLLELSNHENWAAKRLIEKLLDMDHIDRDFNRNTLLWIELVQENQDRGMPWSDALKNADERQSVLNRLV